MAISAGERRSLLGHRAGAWGRDSGIQPAFITGSSFRSLRNLASSIIAPAGAVILSVGGGGVKTKKKCMTLS